MDFETSLQMSSVQEKMIALLKEYGVALTAEDFKAPGGELSEDELDAVAGGGGCGCAVGGSGTRDGLDCGCFFLGNGKVDGYKGISSEGGCLCPMAGAGATNRSY